MVDVPGKDVFIHQVEHLPEAEAKRVSPIFLEQGGATYLGPSVFDYTNSNPLAVVLVEQTTGDAYTATASIGGWTAAGNALYTAITVTASSRLLLATNLDRMGWSISIHRGPSTIAGYIGWDSSITVSNGARELRPGESLDQHGVGVFTGAVYGITSTLATIMASEYYN